MRTRKSWSRRMGFDDFDEFVRWRRRRHTNSSHSGAVKSPDRHRSGGPICKGSKEVIYDPDRWWHQGVHWHAYVELYDGDTFQRSSTRDERLQQKPSAVLTTPDEAAKWVAFMTRKHAHPEEVRLIGPVGGVGHVGDKGHIERDLTENLEVLSRGDSVYYDFRRSDDRMRLWVEAVTEKECREAHDDGKEG